MRIFERAALLDVLLQVEREASRVQNAEGVRSGLVERQAEEGGS